MPLPHGDILPSEGGIPPSEGGFLPSEGDSHLRRVPIYLEGGRTPIVGCIMC